jgi:hypothetical protein
MAVGIHHADHVATSISKKDGANFADKRRSLGRYSSLAYSIYGVILVLYKIYFGSKRHKIAATNWAQDREDSKHLIAQVHGMW